MKVLYITHYSLLYGANKSLIDLIDGLLLKGNIEIILIAPDGPIVEELRNRSIKVFVVPFFNEIYSNKFKRVLIKSILKHLLNWIIALYFLVKLVTKKIDLIHTNSSVTFIGAYLSFLLQKPHVWHIREYLDQDYNLKYTFGSRFFKFWIERAAGVISISNSLASSRLKDVKLKNLRVIYNGVILAKDMSVLSNRSPHKDTFVYGIVGLISREKGQFEALRGFALLYKKNPNTKLFIVGHAEDEDFMNELRLFTYNEGLTDCVIFTGYKKNVTDYYKIFDVLLMCSRYEALGRVTIEAMAKGIVVVGYNNGGTAEIIKDGYNGLLYNTDFKELGEKLEYLLKNQKTLVTLSNNAINTVLENYTIEKYSDDVLHFYKQILN